MSATDAPNSAFKPLSPLDPTLDKIRAAWTNSGSAREQFQGTIAAELDYYFELTTDEISGLLYNFSEGRCAPEEIKPTVERLEKMSQLCCMIGDYLLKHLV